MGRGRGMGRGMGIEIEVEGCRGRNMGRGVQILFKYGVGLVVITIQFSQSHIVDGDII